MPLGTYVKSAILATFLIPTGRRGEDGGGWDRARTYPPEQARSELIIATFFSASCRINYLLFFFGFNNLPAFLEFTEFHGFAFK